MPFEGCTSLTSVTIPDSVTKIDEEAFSGCISLTSVTIGNSVTSIGRAAFEGCTGLISVTIPDSVTLIGIGGDAFCCCAGLTSFYGKFASEDNRCLVVNGELHSFAPNGLTEYIIPGGVTKIGAFTFRGCAGLTSITIPNSVTEIGMFAFDGCTSLISVTIPDSVTFIFAAALQACTSLISIYCKPFTPPTFFVNIFGNTKNNAKIYVPRASVCAYKTADGWKKYASRIEGYDFE